MSQRNVISATAAVLSATEDMKIIHDPETHAGRDGRFHSLQDSSLCPNIVEYLGQRFPNGLYSHQHDAIENVLAGKNTILATRTSSGKSLIYSLPALHTTVASIDSSRLQAFPFPTAPTNEQRRIVAKIEALQERSGRAAKALEEVGPLLEQFRQSILAAAFSGRLTADWRERNPNVETAHELLARIRTDRRHRWEQAELAKYEAKGKQPPKDWRGNYEEPNATFDENASVTSFQIDESCYWAMAPLESLVDPERNVPYGIVTTGDPHEDGVPTVRCGDIKRFSIAFTNLKRVHPDVHSQYRRTWLEGGEVLIAIRGTIGATAVVPAEMKGMNISREVALIPLLEGIDPYFMMYLLACSATIRSTV